MRVARPPTNEYRSGPSNATSCTSGSAIDAEPSELSEYDLPMRPIDRVRQDPAQVRRDLELRGLGAALDRMLEGDRAARELRQQVEGLQAERNKASKGGPPSDEVKARMREMGDRIKTIDAELAPLEAQLAEDLLWIPN